MDILCGRRANTELYMQTGPTPCDILFTGGHVVDGTGSSAYAAALAIIGDKIAGIGLAEDWQARTTVSASGLTLCPGFIDVHTHDDQLLFAQPDMAPKVSQGVTTVITGNCGVSLAPLVMSELPPAPLTEIGRPGDFRFPTFGAFLDALEHAPAATNAACLVGHTTLRAATMSGLDRPADPEERARMGEICDEALAAGAIGVSSGLFYEPARAAPPEEVAELVKRAADYGGIYAAHIRDEADDILAALDEAFKIAAEARVPLILSHHKVAGVRNFGRSRETLAKIALARTRQAVGVDMYPYAASSTSLNVKSWAAATRTLVTWSGPHPEAAGRDLAAIARDLGISEREALERLSPGGAIYFMMDEGDVQRILGCSSVMVGSDGVPLHEHPHPRLWGTFTRVLGHYARDLGLLRFEEAVRRMTGLPAEQFRLSGRGVIAAGAFADLVLVDREEVADTATFSHPTEPSRGIRQVYVNGRCVWNDGRSTGARPGRVLRRQHDR